MKKELMMIRNDCLYDTNGDELYNDYMTECATQVDDIEKEYSDFVNWKRKHQNDSHFNNFNKRRK